MERQTYKKEKVLNDVEQILIYAGIKVSRKNIKRRMVEDMIMNHEYYIIFYNHRNESARIVINEKDFYDLTQQEYLNKIDIIATNLYYDFKDVPHIKEPFALRKAIKNGYSYNNN